MRSSEREGSEGRCLRKLQVGPKEGWSVLRIQGFRSFPEAMCPQDDDLLGNTRQARARNAELLRVGGLGAGSQPEGRGPTAGAALCAGATRLGALRAQPACERLGAAATGGGSPPGEGPGTEARGTQARAQATSTQASTAGDRIRPDHQARGGGG